jgi:hypothetical protein
MHAFTLALLATILPAEVPPLEEATVDPWCVFQGTWQVVLLRTAAGDEDCNRVAEKRILINGF